MDVTIYLTTMTERKIWQIVSVQPDGRLHIDTPDGDPSPCSDCGACCSYFRVSFYFGETDAHPHGQVPDDMAESLGGFRACMKGTAQGGRCNALLGDIGVGPIRCSIYAKRPSVCREFPVWLPDGSPNPDCQRLRSAIGIPPLPPHADMYTSI